MREVGHYNGGRDWFGYKYQSVQHPRLSRFDRYTRKDRSVLSTWRVDGEDCSSLEDAFERLEYSPTLSLAELNVLGLFDHQPMRKSDFADFKAAYEHLHTLAEKGLVWWDAGKVSLICEPADAAIGATESNASGRPAWDTVSPAAKRARASLARARGETPKGEK